MLSDRPYMRGDYRPERTSVLVWLMCGIGAGFILQLILQQAAGATGEIPLARFQLSMENLGAGRFWTVLTYSFLHSPSFPPHIVGTLLGLYFLGRELLPMLGPRRFLGLYGAAVGGGALLWTLFHWGDRGSSAAVIGASAGVLGLLAVFASFYPNQRMTILLFFIFPVTLKPKQIAIAVAAFELAGLFLYEARVLGDRSAPLGLGSLAYSAHLGGLAAGWIYYRYFHSARWAMPARRETVEAQRPARRSRRAVTSANQAFRAASASRPELRAEIDRILDKINSQGFGALSPEEKRLLDEAKDLLSRR